MSKRLIFFILFISLLATSAPADTPEGLFEKCGPAVVLFRDADDDIFGSGVLISADGVILTAAHLFDDQEEFKVTLPNSEEALPLRRFLFRDDDIDLAALQVSGQSLPFVPLARSEQAKIGQQVLMIGNPLGLENSISLGILSGKRPWNNDTYLFQTTAPISPGSSGGGLFDQEGRLLGIAIAYLERGQNLNFCVPVEYANFQHVLSLDARGEFLRPRVHALRPATIRRSGSSVTKSSRT